MIDKLIFNKKIYTFSKRTLDNINSGMLKNELIGDNSSAKRSVLSFVSNSIIAKSSQELDLHEFALDGSFRVSNLLCNIDNLFGEERATLYAEELSDLLNENIETLIIDHTTVISINQALYVGESILYDDEMESLKDLLSLLHLYQCAVEDYEQQLTSFDGYNKVMFINGIGVREVESDGRKVLKPIYDIHDSPIEEYKEIAGMLVAPIAISAALKTEFDTVFNINQLTKEQLNLFLFKVRQLTGRQLDPAVTDRRVVGIDPSLVGKWYRVVKLNSFTGSYSFMIDWYRDDMTFNRSVLIDSRPNVPTRENWSNFNFTWGADGDEVIIKNHSTESEEAGKYEIVDGVLHKSGYTYYRSFEDAINGLTE